MAYIRINWFPLTCVYKAFFGALHHGTGTSLTFEQQIVCAFKSKLDGCAKLSYSPKICKIKQIHKNNTVENKYYLM